MIYHAQNILAATNNLCEMQSVIYEILLGQISAILNITEVQTGIKTQMCLSPVYLQQTHFL